MDQKCSTQSPERVSGEASLFSIPKPQNGGPGVPPVREEGHTGFQSSSQPLAAPKMDHATSLSREDGLPTSEAGNSVAECFCSEVLSHDPLKSAPLSFKPIVSCPDCSTRYLNSSCPGWHSFFLQLQDPGGSGSSYDPPRQPNPFLVLFLVLLSSCSHPVGLMTMA